MRIINLKCDGIKEPLQVSPEKLCFGWNLESRKEGDGQSAYRLVVKRGEEILWDTGKVISDTCLYVPYRGKQLEESSRYEWQVSTWDMEDREAGTAESFFETGLTRWSGEWIGYDKPVDGKIFDPQKPFYCADDYDKGENDYFLPPAPYLRKEFTVDQEIKDAKIYISAFGLADVRINGKQVSGERFVPGMSNYAETVYSAAYPVTGLLRKGRNTLSAILADGWYAGYISLNNREWYGSKPRVLVNLKIVGKDGDDLTIVTDGTWKASYGGVREADIFEGEKFDANLEPLGWRENGFDDRGWDRAETGSENDLVPEPHPGVGVTEHGRVQPAEMITVDEDSRAVSAEINSADAKSRTFSDGDRGINPGGKRIRIRFDRYICGVLNIKFRGTKGTRIVIRHAETLSEEGELHLRGNRSARNQDEYILRGEGEEEFSPLFTYHGFRYAELTVEGEAEIVKVEGVQIGTRLLHTTKFRTDSETVNHIYDMVLATEKANLFEVPTDCTARDERLGWGAEGNHFLFAMTYMNDQYRMIRKWTKDIWDGQREDGALEATAPTMMMKDVEGFVGDIQSNHGVYMVYALYKMYGDTDAVREYFPKMLRFFEYLDRNSDRNIRAAIGCDWLSILEDTGYSDELHGYGDSCPTILGTAHYAFTVKMMAKMCGALGEREYQEKFESLHRDIINVLRKHYIQRDGSLRYKKQGDYLIALACGMFTPQEEKEALAFLERKMTEKGYVRWFGGTAVTPYMPGTLKRLGKTALVNRFFTSESYPSIGYMYKMGYDTIWERWDGVREDGRLHPQAMNAMCHEGYAVVGAYLVSGLAGIDTLSGGFKKILIYPGVSEEIRECSCSYESVYGEITADWKWSGETFDITFQIPCNTTARIILPCTEKGSLEVLQGTVGEVSYSEGEVSAKAVSGRYRLRTKFTGSVSGS